MQRDDKRIFKVIDFGSITEVFSITNKAGTASYLAPERFKESAINEKTEIYSIILINLYNWRYSEPIFNFFNSPSYFFNIKFRF